MTEAEWLASEDINELLLFHLPTASARKLRLLMCASCRRLWEVLTSPQDRGAVEVAEQFADRAVSDARRAEARRQTTPVLMLRQRLANPANPARSAVGRTRDQASEVWRFFPAARNAASIAETLRTGEFGPAHRDEEVAHCVLTREVFGNPFRPVALTAVHQTSTVVSLARAAYDERQLPSGELDPHRLAMLADALQVAGAPDEVVAHLRSPGPHVRGCWALDLCLGLS